MRPIWAICLKNGQKCSRIGKENAIMEWAKEVVRYVVLEHRSVCS